MVQILNAEFLNIENQEDESLWALCREVVRSVSPGVSLHRLFICAAVCEDDDRET